MRFDLPAGEDLEVPELEDVLWLHDNVALLEGGRAGTLNEGALVSALARPFNVLAYSDENPDLIRLGAYLWHGVSEAHAFVDANKRTATLTVIAFLASNGVDYDADEHEIGRLVEWWYANDAFELESLDAYLRTRCRWAG